jgi:hypothetical protein
MSSCQACWGVLEALLLLLLGAIRLRSMHVYVLLHSSGGSLGLLVCWCLWHLADAGLPKWPPGRPSRTARVARANFALSTGGRECMCGAANLPTQSTLAKPPCQALHFKWGGRAAVSWLLCIAWFENHGVCQHSQSFQKTCALHSVLSTVVLSSHVTCVVDRQSFTYGCELWCTCQ